MNWTGCKEHLEWAQVHVWKCEGVILVTRRDPDLLGPGGEDRIAVAVLLREQRHKTVSAYYLTTSSWAKPGDTAEPFSIPAAAFPAFDPGTHLALVSYGVEGFYRARAGGDDRTFEAVLNTRLYEPVMPIRFTNTILKDRLRNYNLAGLSKRLVDNPRRDREEGRETLPFNIEGTTYHLNVEGFVFAKPGDSGERRSLWLTIMRWFSRRMGRRITIGPPRNSGT